MKKTVLVTGGSRGIGATCVRRFAAEGARVVFLWNSSALKAEALQEELRAEGQDVTGIQCDLRKPEDCRRAIADAFGILRHPDILVCNAGTSHVGLFQDMSDADWASAMAVNMDAAARIARLVLPGMISRKSGSIVFVSSMWGQVGASCEAAYSAAKAGLIGLTKALAKEVGPSGIRVNCVAPGLIDTDMNAHLTPDDIAAIAEETPLGRMGKPEEVAAAVFFLAGEEASFITGQVLGVNGGLVVGG